MTEEESILAELRAISNGASANSRFNSKRSIHPAATLQSGECGECECECEQAFLVDNPENSNFNQYWYSSATIQVITSAILEILNSSNTNTNISTTTTNSNTDIIAASCPPSTGTTATTIKRVAFLSTPSLYFALPDQYRQHCKLFDFDEGTWASDPGYIHYDYKKPEHFNFHLDHAGADVGADVGTDADVGADVGTDADETLYRSFDMVVIDPPFITKEVWECYAKTAKFLLKCDPLGQCDGCNGGATGAGAGAGGLKTTASASTSTSTSASASASARGIVLGTTVPENAQLMKELFDAEPTVFQPSIPNLVYQYNVYVNCHEDHHCTCTVLNKANPEIYNCD